MDEGWRYLGATAKRLRWTITGAVVAGLACQGAALAAPLLIRHGIDARIDGGVRRALWWSCAGIVALGVVESVGGASRHSFAIRNRALADAAVRDGIFRRALELDARCAESASQAPSPLTTRIPAIVSWASALRSPSRSVT